VRKELASMGETTTTPTKHDVPKCTCCGYVGPWKEEPVLTGKHWVIGIVLMVFGFVPGLIYLGVSVAIRSGKGKRSKICTNCKAQNLFTFIY